MEKILQSKKAFLIGGAQVWLVLLFFGILPGALRSQQSFTFTPCGMTGSVGPTAAMAGTAYLSTNLNGSVTVAGGIQSFTIPITGNYRIRAVGAAGGTQLYSPGFPGGMGASMQGDFTFTSGTVLRILVGQRGGDTQGVPADNAAPGGGGGSYVYTLATSPLPFIAAGGGGGGGRDAYLGMHATITTTGNAAGYGGSGGAGLGGVNGNGGQNNAGGSSYWAGGGAGWISDGTGGNNATNYQYLPGSNGAYGGRTPANGAPGGTRYNDGTDEGGDGGFGGGGGGGSDNMGSGGGGGFSGGGGSNYGLTGNPPGGGGGSINTGSNQINAANSNTGQGYVIISELCNISLNSSATNSAVPSICSGSSLTLTTNAVSPFAWSTGNTTNTLIVVSPGSTTTYSIIGTSTAVCTAQAFITVTVNTGSPVLAIINPSSNICLGRTVSLTATGALTYTWTNPGVVNGQTFTPLSTQVYTVSGQNGCGISTATTSIVVAPLPVSALATPTIVCEGSPAVLYAVSGVSGYTWQPVALYGPSITVAPTVNTIYTVTASDGTCSGTQTVALTTKVTPTITATTSSTMICQGGSVVLTAGGGASYNWMPGNLSGQTVTVSPSISTLYQLTGTNSVGCYNFASQGVVVSASPTVNIVANKTTVCSGDAVNLFASGANTYVWTGGPSTAGYTINPTSSAVYTVTGTQTGNVCTSTKTIAITAVVSNVSVSSNTSVCAGGSTTLVASGATSYVWNGIPQLGNGNFPVTPNAPTVYTVVATTSSNSINCPVTRTVQVGIFPTPTITIVPTKTLICKAQSNTLTASGAVTYTWGAAGSGSVIVVKPNNTTIYTATGIDANGCEGSQVISVLVNACSGLSESALVNSGITIYPNPSAGEITIETNADMVLKLVNSIGQEIQVITLTKTNGHKANLKDLANGVYFMIGENAEGKVNQKIVVAK